MVRPQISFQVWTLPGDFRRFWRMVDERFKSADEVVAIFKAVYLRDGADAAVEVAKLVIGAAVLLIAHEHGPDEARRILGMVSAAQGQVTGRFDPCHVRFTLQ